MNSWRKRLPDALNLIVDFLRHLHGVSIRLPIDVQRDRRLSVRRDHGVNRLYARCYGRHVADPYGNAGRRALDDSIGDFLWRTHLTVHKPQVELMISFEQSGGVDQIRLSHAIEN